jgi:hypothetical protein
MFYQRAACSRAAAIPEKATPTDILNITETEIKTSTISTNTQNNRENTENIAPWFEKAPEIFRHLIGKVEILFDDRDKETFQEANINFELASDGGHDPISGISTYGWILTASKSPIAKGRGPVQAHRAMAESFRAESYGLASAGLFIQNLIANFGIEKDAHRWIIYIDNQSLIKRMATYDNKIPVPRWNLRSDEDITRAAFQIWQNITHRMEHVKRHQDEKSGNDKLTFPATLNIVADKQATLQRNVMETPVEEVQTMLHAQIRIKNIAVTRDSQRWILNSAGQIPIENYYNEKYGWTTQFNKINWEIQQKVLRTKPPTDQTPIIKFVHGWLPTQHHLHMEGKATSPRCKLCNSLMEDNKHLLLCQHPDMICIQEKLPLYLNKTMYDHGNSELTNILEIGLAECLTRDWTANVQQVSRELQKGIQEQNSIGWIHIYYGRISSALILAMDTHYQELGLNKMQYNGKRWASRLIQNVWENILDLWKTRNNIIHQADSTQIDLHLKEQLTMRVKKCYASETHLPRGERTQWFHMTIEELLKQDMRYIKAWTRVVERLIRITKREMTKRPRGSYIMERFLNIPVSRKSRQKRTQAIANPQAFPQELKPD